MADNQQSTILSEQELALLMSEQELNQQGAFPLYSVIDVGREFRYQLVKEITNLILHLETCPPGSAVILSEAIESSNLSSPLLAIIQERLDIKVFWLGKLPSMEIDIPIFIHCANKQQLIDSVQRWQNSNTKLFNNWLHNFQIGILTDKPQQALVTQLQTITKLKSYEISSITQSINSCQLLLIDLNSFQLPLVATLRTLQEQGKTPFLLLYGEMADNLSYALYKLANHLGYSIIAALTYTPNIEQCQQLLFSLFSKTYLKPWLTEEHNQLQAKTLHNINNHNIESTLIPHGMSQQQIQSLTSTVFPGIILNIKSINDWFPSGITQKQFLKLTKQLGYKAREISFYIEQPQTIQYNSPIFYLITMARLNKLRIYWFVKEQHGFSIDMLMFLPISDIILNKQLTRQLLEQPSDELLDFLQEAKQQQIRICANIKFNKVNASALALYGVEMLLN